MAYQEPTDQQRQDMDDLQRGMNVVRAVLRRYSSARATIASRHFETAELWANKAIVKGDAYD